MARSAIGRPRLATKHHSQPLAVAGVPRVMLETTNISMCFVSFLISNLKLTLCCRLLFVLASGLHITSLTARSALALAMAASRPVFFLHVSSSGGTALCRWAQDQHCSRVPSCGSNCNLNCKHPWNWVSHCVEPACAAPPRRCKLPYRAGCDGLARYVRERNLTFVGTETLLTERPCFDRFTHVVVLRDPVERLQSQLVRLYPNSPNARLHAMMSRRFVFNTSEHSSLMGTAAVDNYMTRMLVLLGISCNAQHEHNPRARMLLLRPNAATTLPQAQQTPQALESRLCCCSSARRPSSCRSAASTRHIMRRRISCSQRLTWQSRSRT